MSGWPDSWKCTVARRLGDESQHAARVKVSLAV